MLLEALRVYSAKNKLEAANSINKLTDLFITHWESKGM